MSNPSMNPGSRPRRGVVTALALAAGALGLGAVVFAATEASGPSAVAGAVELSTFASCEELAEWGRTTASSARAEAAGRETFAVAADSAESGAAAPDAPTAEQPATTVATEDGADDGSSEGGSGDTGDTNVDVAGVDEIDLVERLDADRVLVVTVGRLAVVDLAAGTVGGSVPVPADAQITYDPDLGLVWVVGDEWTADEGQVSVTRIAVDGSDLTVEGAWRTRGQLVTARRAGGELYLVATDGFVEAMPAFDGPVGAAEEGWSGDSVEPAADPAATTAPEPADEPVEGPAEDPGAPVEGPAEDPEEVPSTTVAPEEPTGPDTPTDPGVPFGGDPVPCDEVLYPNGPSTPAGTLIAAFPATGAVEPTRTTEIVGVGDQVHLTLDAAYVSTPLWDSEEPVTGVHRFELDTLQATGSGRVPGVMLDQFSMSERDGYLRVAVTTGTDWGMPFVDVAPVEGPTVADEPASVDAASTVGTGRNEVVVLDTDGALDVVGRTERFGKPGESIRGVRFVGDTAYAVTFLETDPFYVIDVADPTAPTVVGEVELPGFSSYLHPIDDDRVVGFGPDGSGSVAAKLFDVSDPAAPRVADELALGSDSPVAWDHHAFVARDDGFAVPTLDYSEAYPEECGPAEQDAARQEEERLWQEVQGLEDAGRSQEAAAVYEQIDEMYGEGSCLHPEYRTEAGVAVVAVEGYRLVEVEHPTTSGLDSLQRAIAAGDGWALLGSGEIVVLDGSGAVAHRITVR